jgi:trigger factor
MPKILHQGFENDIKYTLDYYVEPKEYQDWTTKIKNQYLKSLEVPGFRKGHAPEELVMKQISPQALGQTIMQETMDKFGNEAIGIMQNELEKTKRIVLTQTYSINPEKTKEQEGGYLISLFVEVLPEVDLSKLSSIKYTKATEKDLAQRMSLKDYVAKEKSGYIANHTEYEKTDEKALEMYQVVLDMSGKVDGKEEPKLSADGMIATIGGGSFLPDFEKGIKHIKAGEKKSFPVEFPINYFDPELAGKTAEFSVEAKEVKKPKFLTLEEVFESESPEDHHGHNHPQFKTEKDFEDYVAKFYTQDTERMIEEINQQRIIKEMVETTSNFTLPDDKIEAEAERIYSVIEEDSIRTQKSIVDIFKQTDLPGHDDKLKGNDDVRAKIHDYVVKEFKLATIWNVIYEKEITDKVTSEILEQANSEVAKNPQGYGLNPELKEEELKENVFALLKKQRSAQWLFAQVEGEVK